MRGVAASHTPIIGLETVLAASTGGCRTVLTDGLASPRPSVSPAPRVWHTAGCLCLQQRVLFSSSTSLCLVPFQLQVKFVVKFSLQYTLQQLFNFVAIFLIAGVWSPARSGSGFWATAGVAGGSESVAGSGGGRCSGFVRRHDPRSLQESGVGSHRRCLRVIERRRAQLDYAEVSLLHSRDRSESREGD